MQPATSGYNETFRPCGRQGELHGQEFNGPHDNISESSETTPTLAALALARGRRRSHRPCSPGRWPPLDRRTSLDATDSSWRWAAGSSPRARSGSIISAFPGPALPRSTGWCSATPRATTSSSRRGPHLSWNLRDILVSRPDPVTLTLDRAGVDIERSAAGKVDLLETLKPILQDEPDRTLLVRVVEGRLRFRNEGLDEPFVAEKANIDLDLNAYPQPIAWKMALERSGENGPPGSVQIDGEHEPAEDGRRRAENLELSIKGDRWPWVLHQPEAHRPRSLRRDDRRRAEGRGPLAEQRCDAPGRSRDGSRACGRRAPARRHRPRLQGGTEGWNLDGRAARCQLASGHSQGHRAPTRRWATAAATSRETSTSPPWPDRFPGRFVSAMTCELTRGPFRSGSTSRAMPPRPGSASRRQPTLSDLSATHGTQTLDASRSRDPGRQAESPAGEPDPRAARRPDSVLQGLRARRPRSRDQRDRDDRPEGRDATAAGLGGPGPDRPGRRGGRERKLSAARRPVRSHRQRGSHGAERQRAAGHRDLPPQANRRIPPGQGAARQLRLAQRASTSFPPRPGAMARSSSSGATLDQAASVLSANASGRIELVLNGKKQNAEASATGPVERGGSHTRPDPAFAGPRRRARRPVPSRRPDDMVRER